VDKGIKAPLQTERPELVRARVAGKRRHPSNHSETTLRAEKKRGGNPPKIVGKRVWGRGVWERTKPIYIERGRHGRRRDSPQMRRPGLPKKIPSKKPQKRLWVEVQQEHPQDFGKEM